MVWNTRRSELFHDGNIHWDWSDDVVFLIYFPELAEESIAFVEKIFEEQGPFDGLLGFSQVLIPWTTCLTFSGRGFCEPSVWLHESEFKLKDQVSVRYVVFCFSGLCFAIQRVVWVYRLRIAITSTEVANFRCLFAYTSCVGQIRWFGLSPELWGFVEKVFADHCSPFCA